MKGLSLWQPWASLMALDQKRIETRSWSTKYRGPLAIASTEKFPTEARHLCVENPFAETFLKHSVRHTSELTCGVILCVVRLYDCVQINKIGAREVIDLCLTENEQAFGNYSVGRYAWLTHSCRALKQPIPFKGRQGLWPVPLDLLAQIEAQIGKVM